MAHLRKPVSWWEPMLPAGAWLYAAGLMLELVRAFMRSGLYWRRGIFVAMRLSARMSRAGYNSWRFWGGKWR